MTNIVSSKQINNVELIYGGKANSLIRLVKMGMPVLDFFVVPADYFYRFVEYNNAVEEIETLLAEKKFSKAKDVISNCKFPISMREEISSLLEELRFELVAVRSSANNEDGASKSFAGQYNTYLNVKPNDVFDKIVDCWSSVLDDNVVSYIGDDEFNIYSVNVVVQRMSNPDYAGVAFSLNPTSRSKNYSLIESCQGLGEKLVSGETTPTKYIVHRELKVADMIFGDKMLTDDNIRELESYILEIEKEYGFPVDTEWCVTDNHIYILQARPITAFSDEVIVYDKIISREKKLFELEIYYNGEYNGIKALTKAYYNNPLFHFENTNITNIYYDMTSLEEFPNSIFRELDNNYQLLCDGYNTVKSNCEYISSVLDGTTPLDIKTFVSKLIEIQPYSSLGNMVGAHWKVSNRVKELLTDYRKNYDTIIYKSTDYLSNKLVDILDKSLVKYIPVLTISEILGESDIDTNNLQDRLNGFVYYNGEVYIESLEDFCKNNLFTIKTNTVSNDGNITGSKAYGGTVTATARIILSTSDMGKFQDGDILITNMTTPKFTSIMKKASGIITDEGGVTCHAAIVARELKVPCLVGTKSATKLISDGDTVYIDADNNYAKIIK